MVHHGIKQATGHSQVVRVQHVLVHVLPRHLRKRAQGTDVLPLTLDSALPLTLV